MANAFSSEDFDTPLRNERQLADIQAQAEAPDTPTEPDPGIWVRKDTIAAKGDLFAGTAAGAVARQAAGANGTFVKYDSTTTTGLTSGTPTAGSTIAVESTAAATHALTTVASQKVLVTAKGDWTGVTTAETITLQYNAVIKDTVGVRIQTVGDKLSFCLTYQETPGAATQNITVVASAGTIANPVIMVTKIS